MTRVDRDNRTATPFTVGGNPAGLKESGGQLWVTDNADDGRLLVVDPTTGTVTRALDLGANGAPLGALGIALIAGAPAVDAARSAPLLLQPDASTPAQALAVAPPRQAS